MRTGTARVVVLVGLVVLAMGALASTLDSGEVEGCEYPSSNGTGTVATSQGPGGPEPSDVTATATLPADCRSRGPPQGPAGNATIPEFGGSGGFGCPGPFSSPLVLWGTLGFGVLGVLTVGRLRGRYGVPAVIVAPFALGILALCPPQIAVAGFLPSIPSPSLLLPAGILVAVAGAIGLLYVVTGDALLKESGREDERDGDLAGVGAAAGRAADRIANDADVDNEVYRAWREMVRHLAVPNPASTTPEEFERAAVEAGMAESHVATITRLFEDVRYGDHDAEARADRAVEALRRIEAAYAEEDEEVDR